MNKFLDELTGKLASRAGVAVANSAPVQSVLSQAAQEVLFYRTLSWVAGAMFAATFFFYFLPRFESPTRLWRKHG